MNEIYWNWRLLAKIMGIVFIFAVIFAIPFTCYKKRMKKDAEKIGQQLLGTKEEMRNALTSIANNPKLLIYIMPECKQAIEKADTETKITFINTLAKNTDSPQYNATVIIKELAESENKEVRLAAILYLDSWNMWNGDIPGAEN